MSAKSVRPGSVLARVGFRPRPREDRDLLAYLRGHQGPTLTAAVDQVIADLAPAACWAQRAVMAVVLSRVLLAPGSAGYHVELGRHHLAQQAGIRSLVTVTRALSALRGPWIHAAVHGRHRQGCSVYSPTRALIHAVADQVRTLAGQARKRGYRNMLQAKENQLQRIFGGRKDTHLSSSSGRAAPPAPRPPAVECDHGYETARMRCPHGCVMVQ